jgi:uncharacterized protein YndB with AHSA1/START domain
MTENANNVIKEDLIVTRILDAPIEMVWKAWTDPEHVKRWWGPKNYTSPTCKIDLREGGKYIFCMHSPIDQGDQDMYTTGVYKKIVPMERLEFTQSLSDKDGNKIEPFQVGMPPDFPKEIRTQIVFRAIGNLTELTITEFDWPVSQMSVYSYAGMHQSIDKLSASLARA